MPRPAAAAARNFPPPAACPVPSPLAPASAVRSARAASTCSSWPSTFTALNTLATFPAASITNVLRAMPIDFLPYMFFSRHAPYFSATA